MPLAKRGSLLLRYFKQISTAPTISRMPTTESTVLRVMTRVRLLPRPEASWLLFEEVVGRGLVEDESVIAPEGVAVGMTEAVVPVTNVSRGEGEGDVWEVGSVWTGVRVVGCKVQNVGGVDVKPPGGQVRGGPRPIPEGIESGGPLPIPSAGSGSSSAPGPVAKEAEEVSRACLVQERDSKIVCVCAGFLC